MDDTIATAWADMVTKLPVDEADLRKVVHQVADELIWAGAPEGTDPAGDYSRPIALDRGFSLHVGGETFQIQGSPVFRITLHIDHSHGGNRRALIAAECRPGGGHLGIFPPEVGHEAVRWTKEDGDQRVWLLQNLRQQVADFIRG